MTGEPVPSMAGSPGHPILPVVSGEAVLDRPLSSAGNADFMTDTAALPMVGSLGRSMPPVLDGQRIDEIGRGYEEPPRQGSKALVKFRGLIMAEARAIEKQKISSLEQKLIMAAIELLKVLDKLADESLPQEIAGIVKLHSKGAAVSAVASAWVPGVGSAAAVVASAGFIWSMYIRINRKISLSIPKSIIKTLAGGVATNLAAAAAAKLIASTLLSITKVGAVGSSVIMGITCYALTLVSGFVYLKILTNIFKAGKDPSKLSASELKEAANSAIKSENIKELIKTAREDYKAAKERGEFDTKDPGVKVED